MPKTVPSIAMPCAAPRPSRVLPQALLATALMATACSVAADRPSPADEPAAAPTDTEVAAQPETTGDRLATLLLGRFDSADQAKTDDEFLPIQLVTCRVDVPALGRNVLYVEQALLENTAAPYRQRLYVIEEREPIETHAVSRVFEFKRPTRVRGLCSSPESAAIDASDVVERTGCAVDVLWEKDRFVGGTVGKGCSSSRAGTAYVTSEVIIRDGELETWDRGWSDADEQVWGATSGGYHFIRRSN